MLSFVQKKSTSARNSRLGDNEGFFKRLLSFLSQNRFLRNSRIQTRLVSTFILLSFLPLGIVGIISYIKSSDTIQSKIAKYSEQVITESAKNVRTGLNQLEGISTDIIGSIEVQNTLQSYVNGTNKSEVEVTVAIRGMIARKISQMSNISSVFIILDNGTLIGSGYNSFDSNQIKGFVDRADKDRSAFNYIQSKDIRGENIIVISKQIRSGVSGNKLGTLIVAAAEKFLYEIYRSINLGDNSALFIMDNNGIVISSRDGAKQPVSEKYKSINSSIGKSLKNGEYVFSSEIDKERNMVTFRPIQYMNWYLVSTVPYSYLETETRSMGMSILILAVICIIAAILVSLLISNSISMPLKKMQKLMNEAEKGNLDIHANDNRKDETATIMHSFNDMIANIRLLVEKVGLSVNDVLVRAEKIEAASEASTLSSKQIAATVEQVAQGATEQTVAATGSVTFMNELSEKINVIGNVIEQSSVTVFETQKVSQGATYIVELLNERSNTTKNISLKIVNDIHNLNGNMKKITNIMKVIVEIAEQTNLLSLNAAIEAARAGEAGRGFAVVAVEIGKLAEKTKTASVNISQIINEVSKATEMTTLAVENTSSIIGEQMDSVEKSEQAFRNIFERMGAISASYKDIKQLIEEISRLKEKALVSIEQISSVTEQSVVAVEKVSASTEEQLAGAEEINNMARDLNQMGEELSKAIAKFAI